MTPAICIFTIYGAVLISAFFWREAFFFLTSAIMVPASLWFTNMAITSTYGVYRLRQDTRTDWNALLEKAQDESADAFDAMHIVILPNFKENERMLQDTLENLGSSPMALDRVRVVLAMEAREGPAGREKAERLVQKTEHLFADIITTYHPSNLPGEVPGKSSNTQYAYREALRHYGAILQGCDLTRVFLTIADADTLLHPQYFSALTYSGMNTSAAERSWRIWQPPVLLLRNFFSVPAMTRASAEASLMFELSALSSQHIFAAFAYSSYSMTLALASHPEVDGWDVDVIAEDHHMFLKCYFAALWESAHARLNAKAERKDNSENGVPEVVPQVKTEPIFLPAVSYLVEGDSYWQSITARFQQARRHSQGVVELGYVCLQYARLIRSIGFSAIHWRSHVSISSLAIKIHTLHITATAQCFSCILALLTQVIPYMWNWLALRGISGTISGLLESGSSFSSTQLSDGWSNLGVAVQVFLASLGQVSGMMLLYSCVCYLVIKKLTEGQYHTVLGQPSIVGSIPHETAEAGENDITDASPEAPSAEPRDERSESKEAKAVVDEPPPTGAVLDFMKGKYGTSQAIGLFLCIINDTTALGYPSISIYAMVPVLMAGWSLFRRGTDFDYIVAEKPAPKAE
jgi:cellulose synthase/poly-beta-1,6-N-acetylglucosamine synthase-like glycosyltransferase